MQINSSSSPETKRDISNAALENLADYFFDKINFISYPFSEVTSGGYTGTTSYRGWSRLPNTAGGKFLVTDKRSRFRCQFYILNPDKIDGYLLSFVAYDSITSLNSFTSMSILRSYAGLKFSSKKISLVIKEAGKQEKLIDTGLDITGSGLTETYKLEMTHDAKTVSIYIDEVFIGSYPYDATADFDQPKSLLPLFSPAKSTDGGAVNIVVEHYQFIQDK